MKENKNIYPRTEIMPPEIAAITQKRINKAASKSRSTEEILKIFHQSTFPYLGIYTLEINPRYYNEKKVSWGIIRSYFNKTRYIVKFNLQRTQRRYSRANKHPKSDQIFTVNNQ